MPAAYKHLDNDGVTQISAGYTWADAIAGVAHTARKFCVQNAGDRILGSGGGLQLKITQVDSGDGSSMFRIALDTATISIPYNVAVVVGGTGGIWGATGTYYYVITSINATGETGPSAEVSATISDTTKKATLTWTQVTGATGYKIYRSTVSGTYTTPALRTTIGSGATVTFEDDGSAVGAGAVPSANTTGGAAPNYGTAPSLGTTPINFGSVAVGQQKFYWVNWVIPGATTEADNPRQSLLEFEEV